MHRPSGSVQLEATAPLLRVALIVVLIVAVVAGLLVVASSQLGWAALSVALVGGPVALLVEGRSRTRARVAAIPRTTPSAPAPVPARLARRRPRRTGKWPNSRAVPAWSSTGKVELAPSYFFEDPGVATATRFTPLQAR